MLYSRRTRSGERSSAFETACLVRQGLRGPIVGNSLFRCRILVRTPSIHRKNVTRNSIIVVLGIVAVFATLSAAHVSAAGNDHARQILVNGKSYDSPKVPVVVVTIDGGDPTYVNEAFEQGLSSQLQAVHDLGGFVSVALSAMPSFTNPNASIITGVPPSIHGISGNFFRTRRPARE